ncbi:MAG: MFS transporter [Thermoplasmata archaeon]|nr:MFS transporter [Thermoplasmata archaeon]MCI4338124.1 MFS transporter [Thermoplasmata archaeon]MCI4342225.1 MFS transporter [Thermoplasmata archaeon]
MPPLPVTGGPGGQKLSPVQARNLLALLAALAFMVTYVETMVVPGFVVFQRFFDYPPIPTVAWILSAYLVVGTVATPIFGKLGDLYGKRPMLLIVVTIYTAAVSVAGFTPNIASELGISRLNAIYLLIGARAVQGVGMAMFPLAFAMIGEAFPPQRVGQAQGLISAMFAAGAATGLFGGSYLTFTYGWQFTYHTVIPLSAALLLLAVLRVPIFAVRPGRKLDLPGAALLGTALTTFLVALSEGGSWGWGTTRAVMIGPVPFGVPELFAIALLATIGFLLWEPRSPYPVVDFHRLAERNIWISNVVAVLTGTSMFLYFVAITYQMQEPSVGLGLSVLQFGEAAVPSAIAALLLAPLAGRWVSNNGPKPVMLAGSAMSCLAGLGLVVFHQFELEFILLAIPMQVGLTWAFISMSNVIILASRPEEVGIQTGMNATFRTLGQSLGPVLGSTIFASFLVVRVIPVLIPNGPTVALAVPIPAITGFIWVYLLVASLGAASFCLSLALRNYRFLADGSRVDQARAPAAAPRASSLTAPVPTPTAARAEPPPALS